MSDGMGREFTYLSSHATNRYFIPNWGRLCLQKLTQTLVVVLISAYKQFLMNNKIEFWMTPTTYGYDTAYCLKSHCGVSFFVPKTLLLHKNMCDKMIVSRFASKKMHKVLLVADLRNF